MKVLLLTVTDEIIDDDTLWPDIMEIIKEIVGHDVPKETLTLIKDGYGRTEIYGGG